MLRLDSAHLQVAARTDAGRSGKNNEDRYSVTAYRLSHHDPTPAVLAVLCDGIGGHHAGEIAAELAVNVITTHIAQSDASQPLVDLQAGLEAANTRLVHLAQTEAGYTGMGATCACAWVIGNRLYIAALGDSRIYLLRQGHIHQLTTDHTWVQAALLRGLVDPQQARRHPNAHMILRYLGAPHSPEVDFRLRLHQGENDAQARANQGLQLKAGDRLVLCSDGLTDLVNDDEILSAMERTSLEAGLDKLVALANQRGGHDNITIVALQAPASLQRSHLRRAVVGFVVAGLLVLLALAALLWGSRLAEWIRPADAAPSLSATSMPAVTPTTSTPSAINPAVETDTPAPEKMPVPSPSAGGPSPTAWPTHTSAP